MWRHIFKSRKQTKQKQTQCLAEFLVLTAGHRQHRAFERFPEGCILGLYLRELVTSSVCLSSTRREKTQQ